MSVPSGGPRSTSPPKTVPHEAPTLDVADLAEKNGESQAAVQVQSHEELTQRAIKMYVPGVQKWRAL